MKKIINTEVIRVIKTKHGFLRDVWEDWGNKKNYDFVENPLKARRFYGDNPKAPKYLGIHAKLPVKTAEDACRYLKGKLVTLEITITTEWKEI